MFPPPAFLWPNSLLWGPYGMQNMIKHRLGCLSSGQNRIKVHSRVQVFLPETSWVCNWFDNLLYFLNLSNILQWREIWISIWIGCQISQVVVKGQAQPPWHRTSTFTSHSLWSVLLACEVAVQKVDITCMPFAVGFVGWLWRCWQAWWYAFCASGGCSSMRKDTSPQTQRWAPSSAKWKEWVIPTWTELRESGMWPTTFSLHRLVTGQCKPLKHAETLNVFTAPDLLVICFLSGASHWSLLTK